MVHGLIFAAGLGTRLKPLTDTMPKALVPLAGKSLLQWQVEKLRDAGITEITVNVHHFPDMIIDAIRANDGWGTHITVSDERDCLLDTGGGLKKIKNEKLKIKNEPILACNVDILSNIDLRALVAEYEHTGVSQLVVSERETQRYLLFDENNRLRGWTNVATGEVRPECLSAKLGGLRKLAFSGMQILSPEVLGLLDEVKEDKFSLIDFYMAICEKQMSNVLCPMSNLKAYIPNAFRMMDVGKIGQIDEAERFAEGL
ncbi:MAG: NTP transferase domain-containing protein [Paludibacteraceae bacterium]|nr:NTP transferase domain-containing protein [Paludibacteraceae bacterium]